MRVVNVFLTVWISSLFLFFGCIDEPSPSLSKLVETGDDTESGSSGSGGQLGNPKGRQPLEVGELISRFRLYNRSDVARFEMVKVSLPFAMGQLPASLSFPHSAVVGEQYLGELIPIKWHYHAGGENAGERHSVAIAQLRVPMSIEGELDQEFDVALSLSEVPTFEYGARVKAEADDGVISSIRALAYAPGDSTPYEAKLELFDLLDESETSMTWRFRSRFSRDSELFRGLSLTAYVTFDSGHDHGTMVVAFGNDVLEEPVSGGVQFDKIELVVTAPSRFELLEPAAYGNPEVQVDGDTTTIQLLDGGHIGDGQAVAFRGRFGVFEDADVETRESFEAAVDFPLYPVANFEYWQGSEAAGPVGYLFSPRFDNVADGRSAVQSHCTDALTGGPFSYLGYINLNPPGTGDQPDFSSNLPLFFIQTVQTQSPCLLRRAVIAVDRESLRPSYYWMGRGFVDTRMNVMDFPDGFFWNGRPHYDSNWNPGAQYADWNVRSWKANPPFEQATRASQNGPWVPMDNQHYGVAHLNGVYELTGDIFLKDLMVYNQSLTYWNYLTGWYDHTEAERCGRLMRDAIQLFKVQDDTPVAAALKAKVIAKNNDVFLAKVQSFVSRYPAGIPAIASFDPTDGRSPYCNGLDAQTCQDTYGDKRAVVAWQTGFHMEYQSIAYRNGWGQDTAAAIMDLYMDAAKYYFDDSTGEPFTYLIFSDPSDNIRGGIGHTWWAGWMTAAASRPEHENYQFFVDTVYPYFGSTVFSPPSNNYWKDNDRWLNGSYFF